MIEFMLNRILGLLVDSLWIGAVSCLFLILLSKAINPRWASLKYYISLSIFFGLVLVLMLSFFAGDSIYNLWLKPKVIVMVNDFGSYQFSFGIVEKIQIFILDNGYYLICLWILGLLILSANLFRQSTYILKFEEANIDFIQLGTLKESLMPKLDIKKGVVLKIVKNISHPFTMGHLKPVIYLPFEAISGFTHDELEMILMHELIHIKRNDYIINLLQLFVETIFFFNPFVWYMSAIVRNERESSCDYEVIGKGYNEVNYAKTLEKSYELHYNLAICFGNRNILSRIRILTMFHTPNEQGRIKHKLVFICSILFFAAASLSFGILTKNALASNLITNETEVYPKFRIEDNGDITFYPDEHRAWLICANGEQAFYEDGVLKNDELQDNFEYQEIDKGDVIEILYVDKLLDKKHKGIKTKDVDQWKAFLQEVHRDYGLPGRDFSKDAFNTSLQQTPFGGIYLADRRLPLQVVEGYRMKYPEAMALFKSRYNSKNKEFLEQMILELQEDQLVNSHFDSVQVVFQIISGGKLLLNKKSLSKNHSDKYLIYLKEICNGFIYEGSIHYIK